MAGKSIACKTCPERAWTPFLRSGLSALVLAAALMLPPCGNAHGAQLKAEATGVVANGYARLVLTSAEEIEADVRLTNGIVIIAFKKPMDVAVDHLALAAPGYVSAARRDPDGTAVRLALGRKVTVNAMAAGERLYVDLLPDGWTGLPPGLPHEVVEDLARRAREAEKKLREQRPTRQVRQIRPVPVRVAHQPTFTRYSFDLPDAVTVTTEQGKERLKLLFNAPLRFDLAEAKAALPPTVASIETEPSDATVAVRFAFSGKVDVRTFREDRTFVLDVSPEPAERAVAEPAGKPAPPPTPSALPAEAPAPAAKPAASNGSPPPAAAAERKVIPEQSTETPVPTVRPQPVAGPPPAEPARAVSAPDRRPPSAPESPEPRVGTARGGVDANAPVAAVLRRQGDTMRLVFPFRTPTAAAVFQRADTLWLVFDSDAPLDLARLKEDPNGAIRGAEVVRSQGGQAVRIRLARPRLTSMAADGESWVVTLGDLVLEPTLPLAISRAGAGSTQASAAIAFHEPGRLHRLADPDIGDHLLVVTGLGPARGFLKPQDFVEFRAIASTHGVAIQPLADDLSVELMPEKLVIGRPPGLSLSAAVAAPGNEPGNGYHPAALEAQSWGFDRQAEFSPRLSTLMQAAAGAPEDKRTPARLDVARFYLARDMFPEAKAVLDVALTDDKQPGDMSAPLVLRAVANIMLGRGEDALKDLAKPAVGGQHQAPLWRALAQAQLGRWAEAREGLKQVERDTIALPIEMQRFALKEAARVGLEVGDFAEAARRLSEFDGLGVPAELRPALSVLSGRLAEGLGRVGDALRSYAAATEGSDRATAAQARLREIALQSTLKTLTRADTIRELESLTTIWRGDETELEGLRMLVRLYTEEGRYRDAFQVMRVALAAHGNADAARRIQDEAAATFETIFLGDRGEALPPVEALGLFYDYRALVPAGRRGDDMIRRLAERLVAVDLLNPASELLQHQVDHRLQGAARVQVASRLATIYLMNRKPDRALQVLRATRGTDLPNDLRNQRLLIEARALSDTGRPDVAIEVVANLSGRESERLRADILWSARRWREAAEQIERMYGERWREFTPLDESERADTLRAAIGYALAEDMIGLDRFRQKYVAKMVEGPERRMFEVVTAPLNARSEDFGAVAKAASMVDTLGVFLRDLRARYPDGSGPISAAPQPQRG